eukprot:350073-Chlamydomonas_euryale.AAC.7
MGTSAAAVLWGGASGWRRTHGAVRTWAFTNRRTRSPDMMKMSVLQPKGERTGPAAARVLERLRAPPDGREGRESAAAATPPTGPVSQRKGPDRLAARQILFTGSTVVLRGRNRPYPPKPGLVTLKRRHTLAPEEGGEATVTTAIPSAARHHNTAHAPAARPAAAAASRGAASGSAHDLQPSPAVVASHARRAA